MDIRVCHVILTASLLDIRRRMVRGQQLQLGGTLKRTRAKSWTLPFGRLLRDIR